MHVRSVQLSRGAGLPGCIGTTVARVDAAPADDLARLFADSWEFSLVEDPLFATQTGDSRYNDRLPRETLADQQRRLAAERKFLARLEAIPRDQLSRGDQVNYDIFGRLKRDAIAENEFQAYLMPITNRSGFHVSFPELPREVPLATVRDYDNYIARLRAFEQYVADNIELMREGIKQGIMPPGVVLADIDKVLSPHIVDDPTQSLLYKPLADLPEGFSKADRERLAADAQGRDRRQRFARLSQAAGVRDPRVPAGLSRAGGRGGIAPRPRVLSPSGAALHHARRRARAGSRHRPGRSATDQGRDGSRDQARRFQGRLSRLRRVPAHRSAVLRRHARAAA